MNEAQLATIALKNHLFVDGWEMYYTYRTIEEGGCNYGIELLFIDEEPVAAVTIDLEHGNLATFVKESQRKKGFGKKILTNVIKKYDLDYEKIYGLRGSEQSDVFYNNCGIAFFENNYFPMTAQELGLFVEGKISINTIKENKIKEYLMSRNAVKCVENTTLSMAE